MQEIAAFVRSQPSKTFAKDEILLYQEQEPSCLFGLQSGYVKVHDISADGSEQLVWFAKKHDILPLEWLFASAEKSHFFYTAHTDVDTFVIDKDEFFHFVKKTPKALSELVRVMADKHFALLRHLSAAQKPRAREKVLHALAFIVCRFADEDARTLQEITVPLTHLDISNLVGITRETAASELKKLKDEGCVDYDRTSFFIHAQKLALLLEA